ncbi:MAG: GNAT family N-acetyltransferase [Roseovarius sp.]
MSSVAPGIEAVYEATQATWPPAATRDLGGITLREGQGGGQRVSAATWDGPGPITPEALDAAEAGMREIRQVPLFMIRQGEAALDEALEARGYAVVDPVNAYVGPLGPLAAEPLPRARAFDIWPPLAIQIDLWKEGGIGPGRLGVMERAAGPKTSLIGRLGDVPAATGFVAIHDGIAMIHALEVRDSCRRAGVGQLMTRKAAIWAKAQGASHLAVLCTVANEGANALYSSLGLSIVGQYHYRKATEDTAA